MSFQAAGLWLWLIPLAGAIFALYLLRMTRKDQRVPATFLWPKQTEEVRANTLIQRPRFNWLMVLQLLAATVLIAALARPVFLRRGLTGSVTVFVLDGGASMGATDVNPNRFESAKKQVEAAIAEAQPLDRIALILAGPTPQVLCPLSTDHARLRRALDAADNADAPPAMSEALRLSAALCANDPGARIVVFSDGTFPAPKDFSAGRAAVLYRPVGVSDANLGVSALGASDTDKGRLLFCAVTNYGKNSADTAVNLFADGKLIDSRKLSVKGEGQQGFTLPVPLQSHLFEARLTNQDALAADNYAATVADSGSHVRVLLVAAGGDPFLEKALALDPRVTLDKTERLPQAEVAGSGEQSNYDLVVFDGVPEVAVKAPATLTFGEPGPASPAAGVSTVKAPKFSSETEGPLMSGVDLSTTFIETAALVTPRNGGQIDAEARGSGGDVIPLVIQNAGARRQIYVAFRPGASDFPLQFAFPIFISNALDFLAGQAVGGSLAVSTGAPLSIPASGVATLTGPDGRTESIQPVGGSLLLQGLPHVGVYRLQVDGKTTTLYATLRSASASHIAPQSSLVLGSTEVRAARRPLQAGDLWRYGLLAALTVLCAEWLLYARRS